MMTFLKNLENFAFQVWKIGANCNRIGHKPILINFKSILWFLVILNTFAYNIGDISYFGSSMVFFNNFYDISSIFMIVLSTFIAFQLISDHFFLNWILKIMTKIEMCGEKSLSDPKNIIFSRRLIKLSVTGLSKFHVEWFFFLFFKQL